MAAGDRHMEEASKKLKGGKGTERKRCCKTRKVQALTSKNRLKSHVFFS